MSDWDPDELEALRSVFYEEATELLRELEVALARLGTDGGDKEALAELLRKLHTLKGSAGSVMLDDVAGRTHALEDRVVALLGRSQSLAADELSEIEEELARIRPHCRPAPLRRTAPMVSQENRRDRRITDRRAPEEAQTVRVEVRRIDELLNTASELVFDRARIARRVQEIEGCVRDLAKTRGALQAFVATLEAAGASSSAVHRASELAAEAGDVLSQLSRIAHGATEDAEGVQRTSTTLQDNVRRVRMLAVGRLFARFEQPIRELARREGKEIALKTVGEDVEIDKAVVERIAEPLLHLLRNAVAHGVEAPASRVSSGKASKATVTLAAAHADDAVEISVEDDGRGVDTAAVRKALVEGRHMSAAEAAALDEAALYETLFTPSFSTRGQVDDLAGRGVGLDAVREAIGRLGGTVAVSSTPGRGSRFTVRLPVATAVQQGLLFKVGGQVYVVPSQRVEEALQVTADDVRRADDTHPNDRVVLPGPRDDSELPLVRLGALLGAPPPPGAATKRTALVLTHPQPNGFYRFAITCDKVIGAREIVVRPLGRLLANLPLYAGATISGAGKVQLILDVAHLAEQARHGVRSARPTRAIGPRRILVVDDSRAVREAAQLILTQGGYDVESAADGWDAWELLQDRPYDLLVTDLEMPRLDGHELIARVRGSAELAALPVLVVSSRTADTMRTRIHRAGASAFVGKPLRKKALLDAVAALLEQNEQILVNPDN
jgi:chemotaxis protein histidine kinase CheA/ActR/RegA family two-component response regulator